MKLVLDKYGMLTYKYQIGPDCGFAFHLFSEVGAPYQPQFDKFILEKSIHVNRGVELPFRPYVADFKTDPTPRQYLDNAMQLSDCKVFTYTSDSHSWYVLNKANHRLYCIGRIGGPRGDGRGINYRDRARERAIDMEAAMKLYYESKN